METFYTAEGIKNINLFYFVLFCLFVYLIIYLFSESWIWQGDSFSTF